MLSNHKKYFCVLVLFMMFCVFVSGGCGGGGGGSGSGRDLDNNNGGNQNNGNDNNGNDDNNGRDWNDFPKAISGTWTIKSGRAVIFDDDRTVNLTYAPGRIGEVGIEITQNDNSLYYGRYAGLYSLTLSGEHVFAHMEGYPGTGALLVDYTYDDYPDTTGQLVFMGNRGFSYIGDGIYEQTQEVDDQTFSVGILYRYTVTLEDANTLRLYYWTTWESEEARKKGFGGLDVEGWWDIVLKKVK